MTRLGDAVARPAAFFAASAIPQQSDVCSAETFLSDTSSTALIELFDQHVSPESISTRFQAAVARIFDTPGAYFTIWSKIEPALPAVVETERRFAAAVIAAFDRWEGEAEPLVLWDIDGTVGVRHAYNRRAVLDGMDLHYPWSGSGFTAVPPAGTWGFRPAMLPLFQLLPRLFPGVKNGILSGRDPAELRSELEDPLELQAMAAFVGQRIYSSHVELQPGESMGAHQRNKAVVREALRAAGLNIKVIDDNPVAAPEEAAGRGLCVARFEIDPRFSILL